MRLPKADKEAEIKYPLPFSRPKKKPKIRPKILYRSYVKWL